ncbi:MAG: glycoside hydrolase family 127 protein [Rikenellaceae bacterium]|nr:glycoside hydrolase family 127 protein [Rikenellaceae bacterium]
MKKLSILVLILSATAEISAGGKVTVVERPDTCEARNSHYVGSRAPLAPLYFIKLPTGSVRPLGWLDKQLRLQKEGLCGHLGEISAWLQKEGNAWLGKGGEFGWEEVPYWLRGYCATAYLTGDNEMLDQAMFWIESILASQREDGYFGPMDETREHLDLWPNMLVQWIMQDYYEYTGDQRVITFLTRYCQWLNEYPEEKLLKHYWENSRGGDMLWSVLWLYNHTGDGMLLDLAHKIHRNTADWTKSTELPNWHNVNIAQGFREPATYYLVSRDPSMERASYNAFHLIRKTFGQVPGGMFGADENARIGFVDPRQGTETCGFVEQLISDQIMMQITGDTFWADHTEEIAFNSYPAAFMPDYRSLRYITCPNHMISDTENHHPGIDNSGPFLAMNPFSSRCCQHNHGIGWPYTIERLFMATPDNGLAALVYAPGTVTAKVGGGQQVRVSSGTNYPFEESVRLTVETEEPADFPLYLRIPAWCSEATLLINGRRTDIVPVAGKMVRIERRWSDNDTVELLLPMKITMRKWQANNNSVSVDYGPLTLSLRIEEEYIPADTKETVVWDSKWQPGADATQWPSYNILPASPWNYALVEENIPTLERLPWPADENPFTLDNVPLRFTARGRLVPSWKFDEYGLGGVLPLESDPRADEVDEITLVPMGAARLRISAFPTAAE